MASLSVQNGGIIALSLGADAAMERTRSRLGVIRSLTELQENKEWGNTPSSDSRGRIYVLYLVYCAVVGL